MVEVSLYALGIPFALLTGTGAGVLAASTWDDLRDSSFGTALGIFALVLSTATIYHGGLLVVGSETPGLRTLLVLGYVLVSIAVLAAILESVDGTRRVATYRHHVFIATVLGSFVYTVGGPLSELLFPSLEHWIHGVAGLFAIVGLYGPVHGDLRTGSWTTLLPTGAAERQQQADWMVPMDDAILQLLSASNLVLSPAIIAYNLGYSREEVNRRLTTLASYGLVERIERGKYRLAESGERYLDGRPADSS